MRTAARWLFAALTLAWAGCERPAPVAAPQPPSEAHPRTLLVPEKGAYSGAYVEFGETEDDVTLEALEDFEQLVGKHQAIISYSSYWGEQSFPTAATRVVTTHGSLPLIFWSPWDRPYREEAIMISGPDKFRLETILGGQWDSYIDAWADAAKAVNQPFFVSLCNEMNGNWFPWSGVYYGGGRVIGGTMPERFVGPEYFKRAYRYIVDRVRARGATNVLWVYQVNNFSEPYESWNSMAAYYPGPNYVDWIGLSAYGQLFPDAPWEYFDDMIDKPYAELCAVDLHKPVMLTEWGVGEFPARGSKATWIKEGFEHLEHNFPRIRAAVYWHERWQNSKDYFYSNLKVNSSPGSLEAYRKGLASPYWLAYPLWR